MESSSSSTALPLEYAAEVTLDLCLLRDECSNAAQTLMNKTPLDDAALEECARLDDALALAHRTLQSALKAIQRSRAERRPQ